MVRMKSSLLLQKLSGLSPGTLSSSSRTCWSLARKEKLVAREESKSGKRVVANLMIIVERLSRFGGSKEKGLIYQLLKCCEQSVCVYMFECCE